MHTISKFFTVLIILMVLIPSTIAAPNENANPKAGLKIVDQSKGTLKEIKDDKVKGVKSSSGDIIVDEKGKNSIKLKDSKPSKVPNGHKKVKVSIPASELQKIDVDNDGVFGVLEIADDDTVIGQRTATTAQLVEGDYFTFSDVEINGFSGYREETFAGVKSGDTLDIVDVSGTYTMTMKADGTIPASVVGIPQNGLVLHLPLKQNLSDVSGNGLNGSWVGSAGATYNANGVFIPKNNHITISHSPLMNTSSITVAAKYTMDTGATIDSLGANARMLHKLNSFSIRKFSDALTSVYLFNGLQSIDRKYLSSGPRSYFLAYDVSTNNMKYGYDTTVYSSTPPSGALNNSTNPFRVASDGPAGNTLNGTYSDVVLYNRSLMNTEMHHYTVGVSGISANVTPNNYINYNVASSTEKIISTGGTVTRVSYVDTSGATRNVTIKIYYTQDTTKTAQTSTDDFHNMSIVHNSGVAITNGTIARLIPPLYTGTAVLESNNTNAVMSQNRTHFTIYTGALTTSDWYEYNVSVPNNANHLMWLDRLMQWVPGVGWNFVGDAPTDYTDDISDEITVTVS